MVALECLQDAGVSDQISLKAECAQAVWEYKVIQFINLITTLDHIDPRSTIYRSNQTIL